jgi:hypothetical protein
MRATQLNYLWLIHLEGTGRIETGLMRRARGRLHGLMFRPDIERHPLEGEEGVHVQVIVERRVENVLLHRRRPLVGVSCDQDVQGLALPSAAMLGVRENLNERAGRREGEDRLPLVLGQDVHDLALQCRAGAQVRRDSRERGRTRQEEAAEVRRRRFGEYHDDEDSY